MRNKDYIVAFSAAMALGSIKDPRAVEPLIVSLKHKEDAVQEKAALALGEIKDPRAIEPLISVAYIWEARKALDKIDPNWRESDRARQAIHDFIMRRLSTLYWVSWERLESALESINPNWTNTDAARQTLPNLILALVDKSRDTRRWALNTLNKIDPNRRTSEATKQAMPALVAALKDNECDVRFAAQKALETIDVNWYKNGSAKQAVQDLIRSLPHINYSPMQGIFMALDKIDPNWPNSAEAKSAVPDFIASLKDKDPNVRFGATLALEKIVDPSALEPLIAALNDDHLRDVASHAIEKIDIDWANSETAKRCVPKLLEALISCGKDTAHSGNGKRLANVLGKIKDPRTVEPLIMVWERYRNSNLVSHYLGLGYEDDKISEEREAITKALENIDPKWTSTEKGKQAVLRLIKALPTDIDCYKGADYVWNSYSRKIIDQVAEIGKPIVEDLIAMLLINLENCETLGLAYAAAFALGEIKDLRAVEPLKKACKDGATWRVTEAAEYALKRIDERNDTDE